MRILLGNALAGFLDLGVGALIAAAVLSSLGIQPVLWHLAAAGVLAVLPDFDILLPIISGREPVGNHRMTFMHRPLIVIPVVSLAAYLLGGQAWGIVALLCVLWHYLHDTPPLSQGGIAWLWPYDSRYWSPWGPTEPKLGSMAHNEWLKKYWLQLSPLLCIEVGAGLMALALALFIVWQ